MTRSAVGMRFHNEHCVDDSTVCAQNLENDARRVTSQTSSSVCLPYPSMATPNGGNAAMATLDSVREHRFNEMPLTSHDVLSQLDASTTREGEPRRAHYFTANCAMQSAWRSRDEGCAIRRLGIAGRRIAFFFASEMEVRSSIKDLKVINAYGNDCLATECCVHDSSFSTSSCPATSLRGVADAFPPRSPGGRRFARGFFPSNTGDGCRGGNTFSGDNVASGGTTGRQLLVGERNCTWCGSQFGIGSRFRVDTWPAFDRTSQCRMGSILVTPKTKTRVHGMQSINWEGVSGKIAFAA